MCSIPPLFLRPNEAQFALHQVVDQRHGGVVAAVSEYPAGWQVRSNVDWNFEHVSFPVTSYAQARNPHGVESFEFLPAESFFWVGPMTYSQGLNVLGQTCMPPMSVVDAMINLIVPKHRGNRHGLRIIEVSPMPQLAQIVGADLKGLPGEGAAVRIETAENGRLFEEEFFGIKVELSVPYFAPLGPVTQINWTILWPFCFGAEKGELDSRKEMF